MRNIPTGWRVVEGGAASHDLQDDMLPLQTAAVVSGLIVLSWGIVFALVRGGLEVARLLNL